MGQFPHTCEVQAVMCTSEITGDLVSDFMESKAKWFFDVSCHPVRSLVFVVDFAAHHKNRTKVCIYSLLHVKEVKERNDHPYLKT